jgi:hypothetical protein
VLGLRALVHLRGQKSEDTVLENERLCRTSGFDTKGRECAARKRKW